MSDLFSRGDYVKAIIQNIILYGVILCRLEEKHYSKIYGEYPYLVYFPLQKDKNILQTPLTPKHECRIGNIISQDDLVLIERPDPPPQIFAGEWVFAPSFKECGRVVGGYYNTVRYVPTYNAYGYDYYTSTSTSTRDSYTYMTTPIYTTYNTDYYSTSSTISNNIMWQADPLDVTYYVVLERDIAPTHLPRSEIVQMSLPVHIIQPYIERTMTRLERLFVPKRA